jgi:serine/threonine-protein kinase RsbW
MPNPLRHAAADYADRHALDGVAASPGAPHRLVLEGRPEQVSTARAFVRRILGDDHPGTERAVLLTSELVTNSINHSRSRRDGGTVIVVVTAAVDRVRIEVLDDGGDTVPTLRPSDIMTENGRGLRLVDTYSVAWDYHRTGTRTVTWFECLAEPLP